MEAVAQDHKDHGITQMVLNLSTGEELHFSGKDTTPEYLLLYAHYSEIDQLPLLFSACQKGALGVLIEKHKDDLQKGGRTLSFGDWCVLLK